jgi:hypothetical protein
MTEKSYFWYGLVTGDATLAPYDSEEYTDVFSYLSGSPYSPELYSRRIGPSVDLDEGISVKIQSNSVFVRPGLAKIDGKIYANEGQVISFDCSAVGYYQLVLRKTFAHLDEKTLVRSGQTVRMVMRYDPDDWYPFVINLFQEDGVIWDTEIARFYQNGTILADGSSIGMTLAPINYKNNLNIIARQGGSATNWATGGTQKYVCRQSRMEVGTITVAGNPQAATFVKPFAYNPNVIIQPAGAWTGSNLCISAISTTGFSVRFDDLPTKFFYWAVGPEG